jgi:hypothetical protein
MAFKAVSNCLKTGTELVYIGLVMIAPQLVWGNGIQMVTTPNPHL